MKKVGILGGTFNPIHTGHLLMGQVASEELGLEKVIYVPSFLPPHKTGTNVISASKRLKMVKLAIKGKGCFEVSDFEVKKKGKSYSVDTVRYFKEKAKKKTKFYFIIGEDSAPSLSSWKEIDSIIELVDFVCLNRPGSKRIKTPYSLKYLTMPGLDISSSHIRNQIKKKRSIRYLVPNEVERYIKKHKLYQ